MKVRLAFVFLLVAALLLFGSHLSAQDLGPQFRKIQDGIYAYVGKNLNSNSGIVLTQDGVVLIDSGHNPTDSRAMKSLDEIKKELRMPEYDDWATKERIPSNIEAAYKAVKGN